MHGPVPAAGKGCARHHVAGWTVTCRQPSMALAGVPLRIDLSSRRVHGTCTTTHRRSTFGILSLDARWCRGRHEAAAGPGAPWTLHHSFWPCCAAAARGHHHVRRRAGILLNRSARPAVHYSAQTQTTASFNSDLCAGACTVGPGSL